MRLVGKASKNLKGRWRTSPMHDVVSGEPLGRWALFHSTAWPAIEDGFEVEAPPFVVSALFRPELERLCLSGDASLQKALLKPETAKTCLAFHVEQLILSSMRTPLALWNRK